MEGASRQHWGWIAAAVGLALAMRLLALWLAGDVTHYGDPLNYVRLATALIDGHGLALQRPEGWSPTALFPPGLPLLLAAVGLVLPLGPPVILLVNTVIDVAAALLLGRLAAQLGRRDLGVALALAYLLWPSIGFMAPLAYKEGLIIALLLAFLTALLSQAERGGYRWAVAGGVAGGALVLTQPSLAPLLPMLLLVLARRFGTFRRWFRVSACAAAVVVLMMLPWWVRNAMQFGEFIPLTTSGGGALWIGTHPSGGMVWQAAPAEWAFDRETDFSRFAAAQAWRVIAADPGGYLLRCLAKLPLTFFGTNWALDQLVLAPGASPPDWVRSNALRFGLTMVELGAVLVALVGLLRWPRSMPALLLWACIAQVMLFSIWFEFSERHRLFMTPFILLLTAMTLAETLRQPKGRLRA